MAVLVAALGTLTAPAEQSRPPLLASPSSLRRPGVESGCSGPRSADSRFTPHPSFLRLFFSCGAER